MGFRVDAVYRGAKVLAGKEFRPMSALAVHHGRIVALGEDAAELPAHREVDLAGAWVAPGFHDAHNHMAWYGRTLSELDVSPARCRGVRDVYDVVAEAARTVPEGGWIVGSGYDQTRLEGGHPTRDGLDRAAPRHKVRLSHTTGHMMVVNSLVLRQIDLDNVPVGGDIVTDEHGVPTGLLREQAQRLLDPLTYPVPMAELVRALGNASQRYLAEGITSVQEAGIGRGLIGSSPVELAAYQRARDEGGLGVRATVMIGADGLHDLVHADGDDAEYGLDLGLRTGMGDEWLRIGPVKLFSDGSLVGRTCAMREPFAGEPDNVGYFQTPPDRIAEIIRRAHRSGWQIATHAIGDRAIGVVLNAYAAALAEYPRRDHRHRIEHCAVIDEPDLARVAELGVIPVPQGKFLSEIGDGMRAALGEDREPWCYRQRSFLAAGCVLPGSSDRPVVNGAPLAGIRDMVRRRTSSGHLLGPDERITPAEALRAYTYGSAYATFQDRDLGTLDVGKRADFVALSGNPAEEPDGIEVLGTWVGGQQRYQRPLRD